VGVEAIFGANVGPAPVKTGSREEADWFIVRPLS